MRSSAARSAATFAALGFAHHLQGHVDQAIDCYHQALGLKPDDGFCTEMLARALQDALQS